MTVFPCHFVQNLALPASQQCYTVSSAALALARKDQLKDQFKDIGHYW